MTVEMVLYSLTSAIVGGLIVAIANHWMARTRELEKKIADIRIEYLIDCCLQIERATNLGSKASLEAIEESYEALERAFSKIMLLGDPVEVDAIKQFGRDYCANRNATPVDVLNSLRDNLRRKLGLGPAGKWDMFFRMRLDRSAIDSALNEKAAQLVENHVTRK